MKRYDFGHAIINGKDVNVDTRHIEGTQGVVAEILIRTSVGPFSEYGHHFVCRSSFRRACKRHKASHRETVRELINKNIVNSSFSYGNYIKSIPMNYLTVDEWNRAGFLINKGETSYVRDYFTSECLFNNYQVKRKAS